MLWEDCRQRRESEEKNRCRHLPALTEMESAMVHAVLRMQVALHRLLIELLCA